MPAQSKAQQRFMGMVHGAQKGEKPASARVAKVAQSIEPGDANDFASTKHRGLPAKKEALQIRPGTDVHVKQQIKIALRTLKMNDPMLGVMGGMSKREARAVLKKYAKDSGQKYVGEAGRRAGEAPPGRPGTITRSFNNRKWVAVNPKGTETATLRDRNKAIEFSKTGMIGGDPNWDKRGAYTMPNESYQKIREHVRKLVREALSESEYTNRTTSAASARERTKRKTSDAQRQKGDVWKDSKWGDRPWAAKHHRTGKITHWLTRPAAVKAAKGEKLGVGGRDKTK